MKCTWETEVTMGEMELWREEVVNQGERKWIVELIWSANLEVNIVVINCWTVLTSWLTKV